MQNRAAFKKRAPLTWARTQSCAEPFSIALAASCRPRARPSWARDFLSTIWSALMMSMGSPGAAAAAGVSSNTSGAAGSSLKKEAGALLSVCLSDCEVDTSLSRASWNKVLAPLVFLPTVGKAKRSRRFRGAPILLSEHFLPQCIEENKPARPANQKPSEIRANPLSTRNMPHQCLAG